SEAQRKLDQAVRAYERAAILAPNEPEPLVSLIKLEMVQDHPAAAQVRLETLLTTNPKHLFAHGLLGEVLTIAGHHAEADLHFREAVRIHPKWITPWLDWAGLWLSQKKPDLAVQVVQSGLQVNPESEELYMLLAAAYSEEGRIDSAIDAYDAVLRFNPRNVLAANNLAVLLVDHKADQPSLQKAFALSRDFEKDAPHPLFLDTLGWVRFKMGQQEEALRLMKTATAKLPDAAVLNYHLGMAFYRTGQTRQARSYFAKALESNENFNGRKETEQILSQMRG
ncbi:tetratricopeptide repeat protein, partial [Petrachloros mirabilis]